ncbi:hypothetical protein SAMD00019534_023250 [Acytostelium subglobosum LB1]|uniref:hypothetical protein n=1 Tax=Acytostelium subglobosum LB1 TaxID=1410327 RepID=UPI000644CBA2|nr:hypothetical protein SAMD00019534_023250 [Acytostelium subglobosum LB1]GAM19150.1 hypothetical protein SAMD00019534_023250 [Acytostelium subglobosum LB1]|eukprot:XP_012757077.1 hypothetical protein SAMD00019534_023250 [Acytostelium subglobosum LB1]
MNNDDMTRCQRHGKILEMLCIDCQQLVCSSCVVIDHKKHELDFVDVIKELITEKKCNDMFDKRLQSLWTSVQEHAAIYKSLSDTRKQIHDYFKELHEFLVIEEHKLMSPVNKQIDETQSSINNIIDEIRDISTLFNLSTNASIDNDNHNNDMHVDEHSDKPDNSNSKVESIQSCTTLEEFINKTCPATIRDMVDDHQLLTLVNQGVERIKTDDYAATQPVKVTFDNNRLVEIKQQLRSTYTSTYASSKTSAGLVGSEMIFTISGQGDMKLFDPRSGTVQRIPVFNNLFSYKSYALYARGHLYLFGKYQTDNNEQLMRYSFETQQWTSLDTHRMRSEGILACYDGNKSIYVLGKALQSIFDPHQRNELIRIDIDTLKVTKIGEPLFQNDSFPISLHYFNTQIFAVLPDNGPNNNTCLWTINPFNGYVSQSFSMDPRISNRLSCHDGKGKLYFKDTARMFELSLTTGTTLFQPDFSPAKLDTMLYFNNNDILIDGKFIKCNEDNQCGSCLVDISK